MYICILFFCIVSSAWVLLMKTEARLVSCFAAMIRRRNRQRTADTPCTTERRQQRNMSYTPDGYSNVALIPPAPLPPPPAFVHRPSFPPGCLAILCVFVVIFCFFICQGGWGWPSSCSSAGPRARWRRRRWWCRLPRRWRRK